MVESKNAVDASLPKVAVSACLLGWQTRFDGGHKRDRFISGPLSEHLDLRPLCPEFELGLGTPRPTLRLVSLGAKSEAPRLIEPKTGRDLSEDMDRYAQAKLDELAEMDICGFIAMKGSPSCGMERVRVYPPVSDAAPNPVGSGAFLRALRERFPLLPIEENGRLRDPVLRAGFLERVYAYGRLRDFFQRDWSYGELVDFHSKEKLLLMSHSCYRQLGRMVAHGRHRDRAELATAYTEAFLRAIEAPATTGKQVNVLQHIAGYFRGALAPVERKELHGLIDDYRRRLVPLLVPLTLANHFARRLELDYLLGQSYFAPHPKELRLRTHLT